MKLLSRAEETLLLAIWRLQDNAYGVKIREQVEDVTGQSWAFGALFVTLERLVKKEMLTSYLTDPTPERGGRSKRVYKLTLDGRESLVQIQKVQKELWDGIEGLAPEKGK